MIPILFKIGPFTVYTYGVLIALGLFVALQYLLALTRKHGIDDGKIMDVVLVALLSGFAGARLTYVLFNLRDYLGHPLDVLKIWQGGLVFYGGFLSGAVTAAAFVYYKKTMPPWTLADLMAPAIALAHVFGRLGCFAAGCCYGSLSDAPWAVTFRSASCLAHTGVSLHPAQLYEAAGNFAVFIALDRMVRRPHKQGEVFGWYLLFYSVVRFVSEFFRGDERGSFIYRLSPGQLIAIAAFILSVVIIWRRRHV